MDIQMGETKIVWIPHDIKEHCDSQSLWLQVQFSKQPSMTWPYSLTMVAMTDNHLRLILETYKQGPEYLSKKKIIATHTRNIHSQWNCGHNASPDLVFIYVLNCWFSFSPEWHSPAAMLIPLSNVPQRLHFLQKKHRFPFPFILWSFISTDITLSKYN